MELREIYSLPETVQLLVEHLEAKYPDRCIRIGQTLEEAHFEAGQRSVVDYLIGLRKGPEGLEDV